VKGSGRSVAEKQVRIAADSLVNRSPLGAAPGCCNHAWHDCNRALPTTSWLLQSSLTMGVDGAG
jgi:hypothetical protein